MGLFTPKLKSLIIQDTLDFINITPLKHTDLWNRNKRSYRRLLALAGEWEIMGNLLIFTSYIKQGMKDNKQGMLAEYSENQLRAQIALAVHYFLLEYCDTIRYQTKPEWHIGGIKVPHNWVNEANLTTSLIGQLLREPPILFLSE